MYCVIKLFRHVSRCTNSLFSSRSLTWSTSGVIFRHGIYKCVNMNGDKRHFWETGILLFVTMSFFVVCVCDYSFATIHTQFCKCERDMEDVTVEVALSEICVGSI